ncbi:hypothetical protein Zm00014a_004311 [Zea mays]|uniref:Uncharacterized protein n=1 Tax=Zea mays TaxID=4577 RepID=A0A3L6FGC3_MAIZE|nr:hypothetical protein Zm00014a_004311 [Zea mays]
MNYYYSSLNNRL